MLTSLKTPNVLSRNPEVDKGWILNAGLTVAGHATLFINSSDTSWLKINSDGLNVYPIHILGGFKIDSVKISYWNPVTNNYTSSEDSGREEGGDVQIGTPRLMS